MRKEIVLALVTIALAGGFLLGRQFPVHHYEPWREARWAYDTTTGKICDPWGTPNLIDKALARDAWDQEAAKLKDENTHPPCSQ
jgi:hypothetical protein